MDPACHAYRFVYEQNTQQRQRTEDCCAEEYDRRKNPFAEKAMDQRRLGAYMYLISPSCVSRTKPSTRGIRSLEPMTPRYDVFHIRPLYSTKIPRTTGCSRPLQNTKVPPVDSQGAGLRFRRTTASPNPSKSSQATTRSSLPASVFVPRTTVSPGPLKKGQTSCTSSHVTSFRIPWVAIGQQLRC